MYDVIIVGAGPAGLTAALYSARANLKTLILESSAVGGQMNLTFEIENFPGFEKVSGYDLGQKMLQNATKIGCELLNEEAIKVGLNGKIKRVTTDSGSYEAKALILAMGASSKKLKVIGEEKFTGSGVSYCATCDGGFYRNKVVTVFGGGNTALTDVIYLAKIAQKVILVHRREGFRADKTLLEKAKSLPNVIFMTNFVCQEIYGEKKVGGVKLKNVLDGGVVNVVCDGVFVAIGIAPHNQLIEGKLPLDDNGFVKSTETKTKFKNVFVVGDLRSKDFRQIVTATSDGAMATSKIIK